MAKSYADLWKEAEDLGNQGEDVANFSEAVAKLPYQLKDEFRKAGDPELDQQINRLQSDTFGAAINGLNKYQDISNPFARRALAENYQGGIETQWKNAVDERTRRQGVYSDYIAKWTGLYGAEAAKKQDLFNNAQRTWDNEKTLADTEENNRRWNIENARAEKSAKATSDKTTTIGKINELKTAGATWEEISQFLASPEGGGIDTVHGSEADIELNRAFVPGFKGYEKELTPTQKLDEIKLKEVESKGTGSLDRPYKNEGDAEEGDYYWSGTTKKKKINWWRDKSVN
jgi:hypothetical protein